jgi:hypothetical protein
MPVCPHCKEDIKEGAKICPHCRKNIGPGCWSIGCLGLVILGVLFFLIPAIATSLNTAKEQVKGKSIKTSTGNVSLTDKIQMNFKRPGNFDGDKEQFPITISNLSDKQFQGSIYIDAVDLSNKRIDGDSIIDFKLAPKAEKMAILWFKNSANINTLKYSVTGKLNTIVTEEIDVPFKEENLRPGVNYMTVTLSTPVKDRTNLQKIVNIYKKKYKEVNGFSITFFDSSTNANKFLSLTDNSSDDEVNAAANRITADYAFNATSGLDELKVH